MKSVKFFVTVCFWLALPSYVISGERSQIELVEAFPNLGFTHPVFLTHSIENLSRDS